MAEDNLAVTTILFAGNGVFSVPTDGVCPISKMNRHEEGPEWLLFIYISNESLREEEIPFLQANRSQRLWPDLRKNDR